MSRTRLVLGCLALAALALPFTAPAQAPADAPTPLTLERALELADQNNPRLRSAAAQVEGARAGVAVARQFPNPEVEVLTGGVRARIATVSSGTGTSVTFAQPLDLPNVRDPRIRSAEAGAEAAALSAAELRLALRAEVRQAFYDVLRRRAELQLATDTQKLLEDIRRRVQVRVDVGEAPRLELTRAEAEAQAAATQTTSARLRVQQSLGRLRTAIGVALPPETEVTGELQSAITLPELGILRQEVTRSYPALAAARAEVRRAEARVETERALRVPQPTLFAGIDQDPETTRSLFGLSVPLPVWNQRQGQIGEAVAAFQQSTANFESRRLEAIAALDNAYARYQVATQQIAAFEGGLLNQAEAALRVAEAAYRFGERGFIEVLDAQRVLRSVRNDFLNAQFERQAALVEIEQLRALDLVTAESRSR